MDDVLHILGLLRERAEADIAVLTTQRTQLLAQILEIENTTEFTGTCMPNIVNQHVWENWHYNQILRIKAIEKSIAPLEEDISKAKVYYKTILAKHLTAQVIVGRAAREIQMRIEDSEGDEQLEIFRQNKKPAS